ncbi:probable serine/threonine-protein kinase At1g01540 [Selaginella moellendorffii]|uniref:probable serine/threonine-protein kinase At1g01540 n=1 Tax=Selaginella moellendorffii TaxID=88036 RepID=UPI000D1CF701|nr:probable serine/threonine-protein kinase At1g01540 [Selaginella moellendorffii]|eukprot:XP_024542844.1 probable serine/threonine-protein kinase At1g01540 [Selaginella moellendorffii]
MAGGGYLTNQLSRRTVIFGFKLWVVLGIAVGAFIVLILFFLSMWLVSRKKNTDDKFRLHNIPSESKEIQEVKVDHHKRATNGGGGVALARSVSPPEKGLEKIIVHVDCAVEEDRHQGKRFSTTTRGGKFRDNAAGYVMQSLSHRDTPERGSPASVSHQSVSATQIEKESSRGLPSNQASSSPDQTQHSSTPASTERLASPGARGGSKAAEVSHLGWGHWYTLRELDAATHCFADCNVLGEGGYGIVYKGKLPDGTPIAVKNLLNNRGQAEKEFRVEVEAIGRVRHKNLVRLLGYCVEGCHRMLVYEYVDNGNLEQWLHGPISRTKSLTWEARMKIVLGTAKALAYLHEALEPKVVHRDIKSSNILIDSTYNARISDFGLAKLLGAGKSHVTTRVMGTFGYVAPEYANTGLLNERSDVYSFGVLLMEVVTGRDPVDYSRPPSEVNLVDWLKLMVGQRRSEEVADPNLEPKPASRALKRALLVALRCVDPDSSKRPKMGHVVHMLEADEYPYRDDRRAASTTAATNRPPKSARGVHQEQQHYRAAELRSRSVY